jgi:hypothetical protein
MSKTKYNRNAAMLITHATISNEFQKREIARLKEIIALLKTTNS